MYKKFLIMILICSLLYTSVFNTTVYAADDDTIPAGDYTWEYWYQHIDAAGTEVGKFIAVVVCTTGAFFQGNYVNLAEGLQLYIDTLGTGDMATVHVDEAGNITYDEVLVEALLAYLEDHPDEMEQFDYQLFQTSTYEELFDNFIDAQNFFYNPIVDQDGCNNMDNFRTMWQNQSEYEAFPHMLLGMYFAVPKDGERQPEGYFNQDYIIFQNYEKSINDPNKHVCFVGDWDDGGGYRLAVYIYDQESDVLVLDRRVSNTQQYKYVYSSENGYTLTNNGKYLNNSSSNAYINVGSGYWNGLAGQLPDSTAYPDYYLKYAADNRNYDVTKLPILATPDGTVFRLFPSTDAALEYMRYASSSNLNWDYSKSYSYDGGSITIDTDRNVTINEPEEDPDEPTDPDNPTDPDDPSIPGTGTDDEYDTSTELGVLQEILKWVKKIYNQVVLGNIIEGAELLSDLFNQEFSALSALGDLAQTKFPFSLAVDILAILSILEAPPQAPVFEIPFRADFGGATGISVDEVFILDFTMFEDAVNVLKWWLSIMWIFALVWMTPRFLDIGGDLIGGSKK